MKEYRDYFGKDATCLKDKKLFLFNIDGTIHAEDMQKEVKVILVGFDVELTTEKLIHICKMLQRDIPYLATNLNLVCPVKFGFIPDCGSICGVLENATGRKPIYIGKPEPIHGEYCMEKI